MILYVDDERPNRIVFEKSFGARFPIRTVGSPIEAQAILRTEPLGVLITDQRMPEMSGNELLAWAKAERPDVVRIIITAYSDLDQILAAVNEGLVARYIVKPWNRGELEQILAWSIQEHADAVKNAKARRLLLQEERLRTVTEMTRLFQEVLPAPGELSARMTRFLGSQPAAQGTADPRAVAQRAMQLCRSAVPDGISVSYEGPERLPEVAMASGVLERVLVDLIDNGLRAIAERGGSGSVVVGAREEPGRVILTVRDDGPGMPPEAIQAMGTPFASTRRGAAGLGLALSKRAMERAGGALSISTGAGGTTVELIVPRATRSPSA